ncbi:uncharacterized protein [Procambarus clarkii]|uniref:uncharacterized protein isoform X2 n=1 Tax=Procambarus clarkii TaxID=6728 RepID=UPI001E672E6B|nr:uncharacterized protein LOC123760057 isoform X2 [Procambarus clarkii]XP_045601439.1 uncharacterized protein LOC123760057 isoform X2 [Procambarus clarkii]XP_045601440.1 uncharacterized protein LOC123760057 isoform X2 [Procambarus clarkii]
MCVMRKTSVVLVVLMLSVINDAEQARRTSLVSPCSISPLGLTCNYSNKVQEKEVNLDDWGSGVETVFFHNAQQLTLKGAACKNLRLYNSTVNFINHQNDCPPRNVLLQYSDVNRIPGRILELSIFHSKLQQLDALRDLNYAFITNTKIDVAAMEFVGDAYITIVDSEIASMKSVVVGAEASVTLSGSNIAIHDQEKIEVEAQGELTLERTILITDNPQAITVLPGGKLIVISPPSKLNLFDFSKIEKPLNDRPAQTNPKQDIIRNKADLLSLFTDPAPSFAPVSIKCTICVLILCCITTVGALL